MRTLNINAQIYHQDTRDSQGATHFGAQYCAALFKGAVHLRGAVTEVQAFLHIQ